VNNTRAVLEALFHHETAFARTPKYGVERGNDEWVGKKYRQAMAFQPLVEVGLGLYFTMTVFYALANGIYGSLPFLVLFQVGFLNPEQHQERQRPVNPVGQGVVHGPGLGHPAVRRRQRRAGAQHPGGRRQVTRTPRRRDHP
jgi:hypothetical protein